MISQIVDILKTELSWTPIEIGGAETMFRVRYSGMEPAEAGYTPEVREYFEIEIFILERTTEKASEIAKQTAARLCFDHVSELLSANLFSYVDYSRTDEYDEEGPNISLIFRTVTPMREWS